MSDYEARFWSKVDRPSPFSCWEWTASVYRGYGRVGPSPGFSGLAHRVSWQLVNGPVPEGLELDHLCRNTVCVNPSHLELVTHAENVRRGRVGENSRSKTHCPQGHPYDAKNTQIVNARTGLRRRCLTCLRASYERSRDRKVA